MIYEFTVLCIQDIFFELLVTRYPIADYFWKFDCCYGILRGTNILHTTSYNMHVRS